MQNSNKHINIFIVHFNTPVLTEALIKSINKFVPNCTIYIFDNSTHSPFLYMQDNIIYIDNTEGQIINFDDVMSGLQLNTINTGAISNGYGSLKHTLSIQKWIQMTNENFILLDSDILLKKDITELFDENYLCVGDTRVNPNNIERWAPFCMFFNVAEIKKKKYAYYNPKYMHGIEGPGNIYDTGAYFYMITKHDNVKRVAINNYIIHYGAASWKDGQESIKNFKKMPFEKWLDNNRKYWKDLKTDNKIVVYTAITGDYDNILYQGYIDDNIDYICFTDNPSLSSGLFNIVEIPKELNKLSNVKKQRNIKINPHLYLKNYDISIWLDGNVEILDNPLDLIDEDNYIYIPQHPVRETIKQEAEICIRIGKDTAENIDKQMRFYAKEKFPDNTGLVQSNIIIRKHNDKRCIKLMEVWWNTLSKYSHRDQLSFNYAVWKTESKVAFLDKMIYSSKYFYWHSGHGNKINLEKRRQEINITIRKNADANVPIPINPPLTKVSAQFAGFHSSVNKEPINSSKVQTEEMDKTIKKQKLAKNEEQPVKLNDKLNFVKPVVKQSNKEINQNSISKKIMFKII